MDEKEFTLDGNAAGGLLGEVFALEVTAARATCASCGAVGEVGALVVYAHAPGTVMRCRTCGAVVLRIVHGDGRIWLDVRGSACLELREPTQALGAGASRGDSRGVGQGR